MAREPRIFMDYACYHITVRGNQKQATFKDRGDYKTYLGILRRAKWKYGILLYAYCLMPNHVHLLIDPTRARLMSSFMHWLSRGYSAYFNDKYKQVGHLWQGRFRSKPIIKSRYLINCADYVEANPVRAGITSNITEYSWSSYRERCLAEYVDLLDEIRVNIA